MKAQEVAEAFGVTPMAVTKWSQAGCPRTKGQKTTKRGGRPAWIYDLAEVGAWLVKTGRATEADVDAAMGVCEAKPAKATKPKPEKRKKSQDGTREDQGDDLKTAKLKAQVAKLRAEIKHRELLNAERERTHVNVGAIRDLVMTCASEFRRAGEILERDFGAQAREIVDHACAKVERKVASMGPS